MGATASSEFADRQPIFGPPPQSPAVPKSDVDIPLTQSLSEDQRLLRQLRKGERSALEQIVHRHQMAIYGFLRARLLEPSDAEDLCQEVFLRCFSGKVRFDRATQLQPWLIGIARNVLREHVRRQTRSKEVAWTELCLELDSLSAEEPAEKHIAFEHLPGCLQGLGPSAREALDLRYGASLRLAEISDRLRRSEGAVKLLIFRARQALRNCLDLRLRQEDAP
mgnify:CR=1 FL=1